MKDTQAIIDILSAFEIEPRPLDVIVQDYFRRNKSFGSRARRYISNSVFQITRFRRRLDGYLMKDGLKRVTVKDRVGIYLSHLSSERNDVDLSLNAKCPDRFPGGEAGFFSFPDHLYELILRSYPDGDSIKVLRALNGSARTVIRVNTGKCSREVLIEKLKELGVLATATEFSPFGLVLDRRVSLSAMSEFRKGLFEVQDEASQIVSMLSVPASGGRVLDYCAGAGGKSLAISAISDRQVEIVATDLHSIRLGSLKDRALRASAKNISTVPMKQLESSREYKSSFDVVLVDAPCSGTGTLRRSPDIRWRLTENDIKEYANMQYEILSKSSKYVKAGGILIYATCSVLECENEQVIKKFLNKNSFKITSIKDIISCQMPFTESFQTKEGFFRCDPSMGDLDGFFSACMTRK